MFLWKNGKSKFCVVIKCLHLKGLTPKEIKVEFYAVHGESAPMFTTVYNWVNKFKCGCTSTKDEQCSGCLVEVSTRKMIDKVHNIVLSDRRIKLHEITETTRVSKGTAASILYHKLDTKKYPLDGYHVCYQLRTSAIVWSPLRLF